MVIADLLGGASRADNGAAGGDRGLTHGGAMAMAEVMVFVAVTGAVDTGGVDTGAGGGAVTDADGDAEGLSR